jgi:hypothetical protein
MKTFKFYVIFENNTFKVVRLQAITEQQAKMNAIKIISSHFSTKIKEIKLLNN